MSAYLGGKDIDAEVSGVEIECSSHFWLFLVYYYHKLWSLWTLGHPYLITDSMMHNTYRYNESDVSLLQHSYILL